MNQRKPTLSSFTAALLLLVICSTTAVSQNQKPGADVERLAQQLQAAEAKAKEITSSSAEMQQVYGKVLAALRLALDEAVGNESKQVNDLLRIITEREARRLLEDYLARLQKMRNKKDEGESAIEIAGAPPRPSRQIIGGGNSDEQRRTSDSDTKAPPAGARAPAGNNANEATISGVLTLSDLSADERDKTIAIITLRSDNPQNTGIQAKADKDFKFNFAFQPVPAGKYTITYEADGWSKFEEVIEVGAGEKLTLRRNLEKASGAVRVIVRDSGTKNLVNDASVGLLYLITSGDTSEFAPSNAALVLTDGGEARVPILDVAKTYKIIVKKNGYIPYVQDQAFTVAGRPLEITVELVPQGIDYYRAIVGLEQSGASSARSSQNVFLNFFFYRPLLRRSWDDTDDPANCIVGREKDRSKETPRWGVWGDIRITSAPQQSQNIFQSFGAGFNDSLKGSVGGLSELKTAVSFLVGPQWRLWGGHLGGHWYTLSAIAGGGALTPFSAEAQTEVFGIPKPVTDNLRYAALLKRLIQLDPKIDKVTKDPSSPQFEKEKDSLNLKLKDRTNIAFVIQDRDRFLRNYFAGLRMQIAFSDVLPVRQMATFDVTFGQDEAVTGGKRQGGVLRLDGFFPLPLSRSGLLYLFGSASLGFRPAVFSDPLLLPGPDTTIPTTNDKTFLFPIAPANRDLYRFGIGINLVGARLK